jgi:hypothetical protein
VADGIDIEAWARTNRACFEVTPLFEMRGSERIQVGFNVDFFALFPMERAQGEARREGAQEIWAGLRKIVETLVGEGTNARLEIEPMRLAAVMRKENDLQPEVNLRARLFHSDDYFASVSSDERARLHAFEKRIEALGLKAGRW